MTPSIEEQWVEAIRKNNELREQHKEVVKGDYGVVVVDGDNVPTIEKQVKDQVAVYLDEFDHDLDDLVKEGLTSPQFEALSRQEKEDRFVKTWSGRSQEDKNLEFLTLEDFGAIGDGVFDNSEAIQSAFNSGKPIKINKGVYFKTKQITLPSGLVAIGSGSESIIKDASTMDRYYHSFVSENASSLEARNATDDNYNTLIKDYTRNIVLANFVIDANAYNRTVNNLKNVYGGEYGTALELHSVENVFVKDLVVKNGIQHNYNVRAGTISYNKGTSYVSPMPSSSVIFDNCEAYDQQLDDQITTHDSKYIWIKNCRVYHYRNILMNTAIGNGIEIDDGSRYVTVENCYSYGGFGGYQAKGHTNTPPAHDVKFINCIADSNHIGWAIGAVDATNTNPDSVDGVCYNIDLIDCTILNTYAFNNATSYQDIAMYIQFYNTRYINVKNLTVDGFVKNLNNTSLAGVSRFRFRGTNAYVSISGNIRNVEQRSDGSVPLFVTDANTTVVTMSDITVDKFTKNHIVLAYNNGYKWIVDNFKLNEGSTSFTPFKFNNVTDSSSVNSPKLGVIKGGGFSYGYTVNGVLCNSIEPTHINYAKNTTTDTINATEYVITNSNVTAMVNTNFGSRTSLKSETGTYNVGQFAYQLMSGSLNETTARTRFRLWLREEGNLAQQVALQIYTNNLSPQSSDKMSLGTNQTRFTTVFAKNLNLNNLSVHADNATAKSNGLGVGDVYRTSIGQLMIVY